MASISIDFNKIKGEIYLLGDISALQKHRYAWRYAQDYLHSFLEADHITIPIGDSEPFAVMSKISAMLSKYGFSETQSDSSEEVVRNYFLTNPGQENALSHTGCEQKFGFKRLSALVFDIEKEDRIAISREERKVPTRYEGITSRPTFYWVDKDEVAAYLERQTDKQKQS